MPAFTPGACTWRRCSGCCATRAPGPYLRDRAASPIGMTTAAAMTDNHELAEAARRRRARQARWQQEGERPLARNLAMIGALGWLVVAPMVGGVFLGRWLDGLRGGGIMFTAALVLVGAGLGMWMVWRRMNEE